MAKRHFHLTEAEIGQFRRAEQETRDVRELKHLQAVRLYGSGIAIHTIIDIVNAGESSIRQWVIAYQRSGLEGLGSHWVSSNASKLSAAQRAEIKTYLHQYCPVDVQISQNQYWTVSDLRVMIEQQYGVVYKDNDSYLSVLHSSGFSYQRADKVYRHQPSAEAIAEFEMELEKK